MKESSGQTIEPGWEATLEDIVIQGKNPSRIARKQVRFQNLFLIEINKLQFIRIVARI
jgi:hypothetical protein